MNVKLNIPLEVSTEAELDKILMEVERARVELRKPKLPVVGEKFRFKHGSGTTYMRIAAPNNGIVIASPHENKGDFYAVTIAPFPGHVYRVDSNAKLTMLTYD